MKKRFSKIEINVRYLHTKAGYNQKHNEFFSDFVLRILKTIIFHFKSGIFTKYIFVLFKRLSTRFSNIRQKAETKNLPLYNFYFYATLMSSKYNYETSMSVVFHF